MYMIAKKITNEIVNINLKKEDLVNYIDPSSMDYFIQDRWQGIIRVGARLNKTTLTIEAIPLDDPLDEVRVKRTSLLRETDYRILPDYPNLDVEAWKIYRQKLRDIPQDFPNAEDVVFPTKPELRDIPQDFPNAEDVVFPTKPGG